MEYRQNDWSILGFGCMRFPKKGGSVDMDETERELAYAIAHGVNYYSCNISNISCVTWKGVGGVGGKESLAGADSDCHKDAALSHSLYR